MSDGSTSPGTEPWTPPAPSPRSPRLNALLEVILCSGLPTQLALGTLLALAGFVPDGRLTVSYVVVLSLLDTVLVVGLIVLFLGAHRERPRELLLGDRPFGGELLAGLPLGLMALVLAAITLTTIRELAPWLRTYEQNPLQDLIRTTSDAVLFGVVVVVAGGIREEVQRAFLLTRFERHLGGNAVGVVVTSVAFGAGHFLQGADAAVATGILGVFWAVIYVARRSAVAPIVSHSCFNLVQLAQLVFVTR